MGAAPCRDAVSNRLCRHRNSGMVEGLPTIFILDLGDEAKAIELAKEIAAKTGSAVTVRRSDGTKVATVVPTKH